MAQPIFPDVEQIMTILMGELPEGVYATDRADDPNESRRSYSSAEIRAHAQMIADAYANLNGIWKDKFITTVTHDGLAPWEKQLFQTAQDSSQPDSVRKANLLSKFRASGGISLPAIEDIVHSILDPLGLAFQVAPWGCAINDGVWILDVSLLDVNTYLGMGDPLLGARRDMTPLDCDLDYAAAGITADQLDAIQQTAYSYDLRIFGHADASTLAQLEVALTDYEPARSTHHILNDFTGAIPP